MLDRRSFNEGTWRHARPSPHAGAEPLPDLGQRERLVFKAIVHSYVLTAEPVGSRLVARRYRFGLSPATIRNVMMDLEEMRLLGQPHASAGRVPTDRGYRFYVDEILRPEGLARDEIDTIDAFIGEAPAEPEVVLDRASMVLSALSALLAVAFHARSVEDRAGGDDRTYVDPIHFGGTGHILTQPEFRTPEKLRALFEAIETRGPLIDLVSGAAEPAEPGRVHIMIGTETARPGMESISIVSSSYRGGGSEGYIGIIGPTRMRYPRMVSLVFYAARALSEKLDAA